MILALAAGGAVHMGAVVGDDDDDAARPINSAPGQDGVIKLNLEQLTHAAIRVEAVKAGSAPVLRQGFARVMDLSPLAAIEADLATARSALAASRAEAARLATLAAQDQGASRQAVEAARAQAQSDAARLTLAARREGLEFGPGVARMSSAAREGLIADAGAGRAALLRIDLPGAPLAAGTSVTIGDGKNAQTVRVIGPAAATDPQLQTAAVLAVLRPPLAASAMAGRQFSASVQGSDSQAGVILPRSALVRWQGRLWAYRQVSQGTFARIPIGEPHPLATGWLVDGVAPGERIVMDGATTLFAVESGSSAVQEDN